MDTTLFHQADGTFTVRAWSETRNERGRRPATRCRVRYWYVGGIKGQDSGTTPEVAVAKAKAIWQAHLDGDLQRPVEIPTTIGDLVDEFLAREGLSPATTETYRRALRLFLASVGADRDVKAVGKAQVARWFASMTCKPVSKAAYRRTLRALFSWAMKSKFLTEDPSKDVAIERHKTTIRPWLSHDRWAVFLDACSEHHRVRAEFVLHTGLRAGELCAAEWTWLHGTNERPAITIPKMKSKHPRAVPLDKRAQELLADAKRIWGEGGRIFGPEGFKGDNMRDNTVTACKKAEVTVVDFHGLRRSSGARWIECGVPLLHVSRLLGHADVTTTARHYAGIADGTLAAEIERVELASGGQRTPSPEGRPDPGSPKDWPDDVGTLILAVPPSRQ